MKEIRVKFTPTQKIFVEKLYELLSTIHNGQVDENDFASDDLDFKTIANMGYVVYHALDNGTYSTESRLSHLLNYLRMGNTVRYRDKDGYNKYFQWIQPKGKSIAMSHFVDYFVF